MAEFGELGSRFPRVACEAQIRSHSCQHVPLGGGESHVSKADGNDVMGLSVVERALTNCSCAAADAQASVVPNKPFHQTRHSYLKL
jgi:hypothetical protein